MMRPDVFPTRLRGIILDDPAEAFYLSVVIPVFNEQGNVERLHADLASTLSALNLTYEIIYVDDGSTDQSPQILQKIAARHDHTKVIHLRRNFGQTAALSAGIDHSQGEVVICLDCDCQNDPKDIPRLLAKLNEGYDVVSGWRNHRQDHWLWRNLMSRIANRIVSWITHLRLHDYGCTLKAYRREVLTHVRLYGQMHRFIPALITLVGASVAEIPVNHHPRTHGRSKYSLARSFSVILDLLTVKFLAGFTAHPMKIFGGSGLVLITLSLISGSIMVVEKFLYHQSFIQTPLLLLSAMLFILGFQCILLGLITELLTRTYFESQDKPTYIIRKIFKGDK